MPDTDTLDVMDIKISLAAARVNAGLTQADVARKLKKNKQTVVNWENGKTKVDPGNFAALCELYKLPQSFILLQ